MNGHDLPSNIEAEQATLGSIFLDRDAIVMIAGWLFPVHFSLDRHALIYEAQKECYSQRIPPDLINVAEVLRRQKRLELIGGPAYLIELANSVPTAVHIEYYARIVEEIGIRRLLINASGEIAALAHDETYPINQLAGDASLLLTNALKRMSTGGPQSIGSSVDMMFDLLSQGGKPGLSTGLMDLDDPGKLGGLHDGRVYLLAGMPGAGKSSLAWQIARSIASREEFVLGFSLEMACDELIQRYIASDADITLTRITQTSLQDDDLQDALDACGKLSRVSQYLFIDDEPGISVIDVRLRALQFMAEYGRPSCIIIDYALLLVKKERRKSDNSAEEVDLVVRAMKALAREIKTPVIVIQQMNREGYKNEGFPRLHHLYLGGEKDADVVMMLMREELINPDSTKKGVAELHVLKHRFGPAGLTIPLKFFSTTTRFADLDRRRTNESEYIKGGQYASR